MAEAEIARHVEEAERRWALLGVTVIHRYGRHRPGEDRAGGHRGSSHRQDAFAAAEFLMDYLKTHAPFWKQVETRPARLGSRPRLPTTSSRIVGRRGTKERRQSNRRRSSPQLARGCNALPR